MNDLTGRGDMNKLGVSLKLIQLLNERNCIDSKTVANELNVSIRTAQRYLLELSALPCVITDEKNFHYCMAPDYKIKEALVRTGEALNKPEKINIKASGIKVDEAVCLICGKIRNNEKAGRLLLEVTGRDNRQAVRKLSSYMERLARERRCRFP